MLSFIKRYQTYVLLAFAMFSVQIGSSFAKDMVQHVQPVTMTWLRLVFGGILLTGVAMPTFIRQAKGRTAQEWQALMILAFSIVGMNTFFYMSLKWLPVGMAVTIEFIGPLSVGLLSMTRKRDALWVLLAGAGVAVLGGSIDLTLWKGIVFAGMAGIGWFGYLIYGAKIKDMWAGSAAVMVACFVGSIVLAPFAIIADSHHILDWRILGMGLAIGLMSTAAPMVMELRVLRVIDLSIYGVLTSFEPALAAIAAFLILNETLSVMQWGAVLAIILAAIGVTVSKPRNRVLAVDILEEKYGPLDTTLPTESRPRSISGTINPVI